MRQHDERNISMPAFEVPGYSLRWSPKPDNFYEPWSSGFSGFLVCVTGPSAPACFCFGRTAC